MADPHIVLHAMIGAGQSATAARMLSAVRPAPHLAADLVLEEAGADAARGGVAWACGDILEKVPAHAPILRIEAGVILSPFALGFVEAALARTDDRRLGAIALTSFRNRRPEEPFLPLQDGSDAFYAAVDPGPAALRLGDGRGDLVLFPRAPLATREGDGLVLTMDRAPRDWRILPADESLAVYDAWLELTPEALRRAAPGLPDVDFTVDLFGDRADVTTPYLLSSRPCATPMATWGLELTPVEANIVLGRAGDIFSLGETSSFSPADQPRRLYLRRHLNRHFDMGAFIGQFLGPIGRLGQKRV